MRRRPYWRSDTARRGVSAFAPAAIRRDRSGLLAWRLPSRSPGAPEPAVRGHSGVCSIPAATVTLQRDRSLHSDGAGGEKPGRSPWNGFLGKGEKGKLEVGRRDPGLFVVHFAFPLGPWPRRTVQDTGVPRCAQGRSAQGTRRTESAMTISVSFSGRLAVGWGIRHTSAVRGRAGFPTSMVPVTRVPATVVR